MRCLLAFALVLPLAAPAVASGAEGRCPERPGYSVVASSGDAVVFARTKRDPEGRETVYRACLRSVGRDPVLGIADANDRDLVELERFAFGGTFVAMFTRWSTRYQDHGLSLQMVDAASGRKLGFVAASDGYFDAAPPDELFDVVVSPAGHIAWIAGPPARPVLRTLLDGESQTLAVGASGLGLDSDVLRWTAGGEERSHRLRPVDIAAPLRPLRCPARGGDRIERSGASALVFTGGFFRTAWQVCLRSSRKRPFRVGGERVQTVLLDQDRAVVIETDHRGSWSVATWDVRARRRVGSPVRFRVPGNSVADATVSGGRVALSIEGQIVVVEDGAARVVASGMGKPVALHLAPDAVAWVDGGVPGSASLR